MIFAILFYKKENECQFAIKFADKSNLLAELPSSKFELLFFVYLCILYQFDKKNLCARLRYMKMIVGDLVPHKMQKVGNDIFQKLWCK